MKEYYVLCICLQLQYVISGWVRHWWLWLSGVHKPVHSVCQSQDSINEVGFKNGKLGKVKQVLVKWLCLFYIIYKALKTRASSCGNSLCLNSLYIF